MGERFLFDGATWKAWTFYFSFWWWNYYRTVLFTFSSASLFTLWLYTSTWVPLWCSLESLGDSWFSLLLEKSIWCWSKFIPQLGDEIYDWRTLLLVETYSGIPWWYTYSWVYWWDFFEPLKVFMFLCSLFGSDLGGGSSFTYWMKEHMSYYIDAIYIFLGQHYGTWDPHLCHWRIFCRNSGLQ